MNGKGMFTGCWRMPLLALVVALHMIPLFAHGANVTEPTDTTAANVTSLPVVGEGEGEGENMADLTKVADAESLRAGRKPRGGEDAGSGMMGAGDGAFPSVVSASEDETGATIGGGGGGRQALSPDSAETDSLLPHETRNSQQQEEDEEEVLDAEKAVYTDAPWHNLGKQEEQETTVFDLDREFAPTTTQSPMVRMSNSDVLTVDFMDSDESRGNPRGLETPAPSAHELQGRDPTSWTMPDNYDYLTPYDDNISPSPSEEYVDTTTTDMYDDADATTTTTAPPRAFRPRIPIPGLLAPDGPLTSGAGAGGFGFGGGIGADDFPAPRPPPGAGGDGASGGGGGGSECRNGNCSKSPCDQLPNYCYNGGVCFFSDGTGPFCRCNVQEYVWNKGARCESVVTEFQVMCIAIGASALMLLLLFMIVVCFAKQLHLLKTENHKLRKRSKYRPSSEQHNDNFSLSTIAEGSHPNKTMSRYTWECKNKEDPDCEDDPHAQNKLEDPVKAHPKEDDSLNIQNSLTPKQENHKGLGDENSSEGDMAIDVELHLPKHSKVLPTASPRVHYDVYLYKVPKSPAPGKMRSRVRWDDRPYHPYPPSPGYSPVSTRSLPVAIPTRRSRSHIVKIGTP
ncbi:chondroitin sulfate proteoglycan 5 isoform X2 [Engraulis encrasicolus]|uniref:chondroitin sulfate proteoglycan 5 isoform X2 n=1 Tax=Engraulis encrasicolus TaxID=184585 RepID=UPI002FD07510